jgi:hypothetical protein
MEGVDGVKYGFRGIWDPAPRVKEELMDGVCLLIGLFDYGTSGSGELIPLFRFWRTGTD